MNDQDLSAGLGVTGPEKERSVSYSTLEPNRFYTGRIIVADQAGRQATNDLSFDTFVGVLVTYALGLLEGQKSYSLQIYVNLELNASAAGNFSADAAGVQNVADDYIPGVNIQIRPGDNVTGSSPFRATPAGPVKYYRLLVSP